MKKLMLIILFIVISISDIEKSEVIIPKEAIRFRVIANSNSKLDQKEKQKIAKELSSEVVKSLKGAGNIEEARKTIKWNLPSFQETVENRIQQDNYQKQVTINYGQNYFPEKKYKGIKYKEGKYESLVVTLGKGKGDNFWCILFPPLCLLEAEDNKIDKVEYKSFIKEIIDRYF